MIQFQTLIDLQWEEILMLDEVACAFRAENLSLAYRKIETVVSRCFDIERTYLHAYNRTRAKSCVNYLVSIVCLPKKEISQIFESCFNQSAAIHESLNLS